MPIIITKHTRRVSRSSFPKTGYGTFAFQTVTAVYRIDIYLLTISAKAMYRKSPAVMAKIHCLTVSSVDTEIPMYRPMKAVREDRKLNSRALPLDSPLETNMA